MLIPVATVISIFLETILLIIPPNAAHKVFSKIIPSPKNETFSNNGFPGSTFISIIPPKPRIHPIALYTVILSSAKIIHERRIKKKLPIESMIVPLELGIYPKPMYENR